MIYKSVSVSTLTAMRAVAKRYVISAIAMRTIRKTVKEVILVKKVFTKKKAV